MSIFSPNTENSQVVPKGEHQRRADMLRAVLVSGERTLNPLYDYVNATAPLVERIAEPTPVAEIQPVGVAATSNVFRLDDYRGPEQQYGPDDVDHAFIARATAAVQASYRTGEEQSDAQKVA